MDSGTFKLAVDTVFHEPAIQLDDFLSISISIIDQANSMVAYQLGTRPSTILIA
jgi:hypothetical protein